jgi:hypothetical protein
MWQSNAHFRVRSNEILNLLYYRRECVKFWQTNYRLTTIPRIPDDRLRGEVCRVLFNKPMVSMRFIYINGSFTDSFKKIHQYFKLNQRHLKCRGIHRHDNTLYLPYDILLISKDHITPSLNRFSLKYDSTSNAFVPPRAHFVNRNATHRGRSLNFAHKRYCEQKRNELSSPVVAKLVMASEATSSFFLYFLGGRESKCVL